MGEEIVGKVKRLFIQKGYGFLEFGIDDVFFHFSDVEGDFEYLSPGTLCTFEIKRLSDGRRKAVKVKKLKLDSD